MRRHTVVVPALPHGTTRRGRSASPGRRTGLTVVVVASLLATLAVVAPGTAAAAPSDEDRRSAGVASAPAVEQAEPLAVETLAQPAPPAHDPVAAASTEPVAWPAESTATIAVDPPGATDADPSAAVTAETLVRLEQSGTAESPDAVQVQVVDHDAAEAVGVDGVLLALEPVSGAEGADAGPDGTPAPTATAATSAPSPTTSPTASPAVVQQTASVRPAEPETEVADAGAPVVVTVSYAPFADAYGGDWSARLRLVSLPDCALDTPSDAQCRTQTEIESVNDPVAQTVRATVPLAAAGALAVTAATSGSTGSWAATPRPPASASDASLSGVASAPLAGSDSSAPAPSPSGPVPSASASWDVVAQTGDLRWTYPLRVPPAAGGPEPDLALAYSSGSVDRRTSATNNQASWVGDGWDLGTGYVERSYVPCAQDTAGGNNEGHATGDLCWSSGAAVLVLNGTTSPLVEDAATGTWRVQQDDGSRVERLTGASNGDDDGEYWAVTTTDGTRYVFGRGQRSATDPTPLDSAWTVPVYGNQAGEPCHAETFAESVCAQAWRWNLEYVVDASGGSMTYFYTREQNAYERDLGAAVSTYDRGGYLTRVEYGQRAGEETTGPAPSRVELTVAERCVPSASVTCDPDQLTPSSAAAWPDVPADLVCTSTTSCPGVTSPAFFTRKRLARVTTQVLAGATYRDVDRWTLTQTFPDPGDGSETALWLAKIGHSGLAGTTVDLPDVSFTGTPLANRVVGAGGPAMSRYRVSSVVSESGATTSVSYTAPGCSATSLPADPSTSSSRCFPVLSAPATEGAQPEYFHTYPVSSVLENPNDGTSATVETHYRYVGGAAWHHDDDARTPVAQRTWGDFRGYATVDVIRGAPSDTTRSTTRYRYFRGMDGDLLGSGGTRSASVDGITDEGRLAGFVREVITYDGAGTGELTGVVRTPWVSPPTATGADGRTSTFLGVGLSETRTTAPALPGGRRTTRTATTFDPADGTVTQVDDEGDLATAADDLCTRTEYARDGATTVVGAPARVETVAVRCDVTPTRPADVVSDVRTSYDGAAVGVAPTRGLVTATEVLASYADGAPVYATDTSTTYDDAGRVVARADALGRTTTTAYTPATGGPVTGVTETSPDPDGDGDLTPHVVTTTLDPAWGLPTEVVDAAGKVTSTRYDALGRPTAVWLPGRPQASATASTTYAYVVSRSGPDAVTTSTLTAAGTYQSVVTLYDGLLRPRQTQSPSLAAGTAGRMVTDTVYDSRGYVSYENGAWFAPGEPGGALVAPKSAVPSRTRYVHDGAGRLRKEILDVDGREKWRTTTTYGGDRVSTDPPAGGVAQTTVLDARGRTTQLRSYTSGAPSGTYKLTTYRYAPSGALSSVRNADGSTWTATYDLRGRQVSVTDPDTGTTTRTYDDAGQVLTVTDARGLTLASTYDALGRRTSLRDGSATGDLRAEWTYDTLAAGQLTSSTRYEDGAAYVTAVTGYDDGYRPLGESVTLPSVEGALAGTYTTEYEYTVDGQLLRTTLPAAGPLTAESIWTEYDAANLPEWMHGGLGWGVYVAGTVYSSSGELMSLDVGNTAANWISYDYEHGTGRLTGVALTRQSSGATDLDQRVKYDAAGNVTKVVTRRTGQKTDTQCFTRDGLGRLRSAWTPASGSCATTRSVARLGGPVPSWTDSTYDAAGNRLTQVTRTATGTTTDRYTYAAASGRPHALASVARTTGSRTVTSRYASDASGSTTTRAPSGSAAQTLTWDAEGRLTTVRSGSSTSSYLYTADGDRLVRRQDGSTTVTLPGGQEITLTADGQVTASRSYTFAGMTVAVRTGRSGSAVTSFVTDADGTAIAAIQNVKEILTTRRFDAFGAARAASPVWPDDRAFLGAPQDGTGLLLVGTRYYDPARGRYLSADPAVALAAPQDGAYAYGGAGEASAGRGGADG